MELKLQIVCGGLFIDIIKVTDRLPFKGLVVIQNHAITTSEFPNRIYITSMGSISLQKFSIIVTFL